MYLHSKNCTLYYKLENKLNNEKTTVNKLYKKYCQNW